MRVTIAGSEAAFFQAVAWRIVAQVMRKPTSVIGLATGRTTGGVHAVVRDIHERFPFDVSRITLVGLDEVTNVPREYAGSCHATILKEVAGPLGILDDNFIMPPTRSDDFPAECRRFEERIAERGGVDLQILGLGEDGHLGFNQPGTPFERTTWHSRMDNALEARIRKETRTPDDVPLGGVTLGLKNIMQTPRLVLAANGRHKAKVVASALTGPVTTALPASVLQLHPDCEVILDPAAAEELPTPPS